MLLERLMTAGGQMNHPVSLFSQRARVGSHSLCQQPTSAAYLSLGDWGVQNAQSHSLELQLLLPSFASLNLVFPSSLPLWAPPSLRSVQFHL